MEVNTNISNQ